MSIDILNEMKTDFLVYSAETNNNRAFPDARDGLKPVKRAALYEMYKDGFTSNKPHVKSAKITGATIANFHPHGDESVYDTMVRMSQPWLNNIPEIDWHGANGSELGGPEAAASRYTECRLAKSIEEGMFSNIKKDTVDFMPNYSEDLEWPKVLPSIFPRLLINGDSGIGSTIANNWSLHNLSELTEKIKTYLKTKKIDYTTIYPDYPSGGIIINKKDLASIYETGKGNIIVRAKTEIKDNYILVTELPYQVYVEPLIQKIKDLVNNSKISGIEDIKNKSDNNGLLIEIECNENPNVVLNKLFTLTDLQCMFNVNQMALVNGVPELLSFKDYLDIYIDHNLNCLIREYTYDLNQALKEKEITEGLIKAVSIIDDIISIIRSSENSDIAKKELQNKFNFTVLQSQAIIDMRLGKLANTDVTQLQLKNKELSEIIKNCNLILDSKNLLEKEFITRLEDFTKKYNWTRKTQVLDIDYKAEKTIIKKETITKKEFMVVLTTDNTIRKVALNQYRAKNDIIIDAIKLDSSQKVVLITDKGNMYKIPVSKLELGTVQSTGSYPIENETIIRIFSGNEEEQYLFFITTNGLAKKIKTEESIKISKKVGTSLITLDNDDFINLCQLVNNDVLNVTFKNKTYKVDTSKFIAKHRKASAIKCFKSSMLK